MSSAGSSRDKTPEVLFTPTFGFGAGRDLVGYVWTDFGGIESSRTEQDPLVLPLVAETARTDAGEVVRLLVVGVAVGVVVDVAVCVAGLVVAPPLEEVEVMRVGVDVGVEDGGVFEMVGLPYCGFKNWEKLKISWPRDTFFFLLKIARIKENPTRPRGDLTLTWDLAEPGWLLVPESCGVVGGVEVGVVVFELSGVVGKLETGLSEGVMLVEPVGDLAFFFTTSRSSSLSCPSSVSPTLLTFKRS
jgi:hypothetical protein